MLLIVAANASSWPPVTRAADCFAPNSRPPQCRPTRPQRPSLLNSPSPLARRCRPGDPSTWLRRRRRRQLSSARTCRPHWSWFDKKTKPLAAETKYRLPLSRALVATPTAATLLLSAAVASSAHFSLGLCLHTISAAHQPREQTSGGGGGGDLMVLAIKLLAPAGPPVRRRQAERGARFHTLETRAPVSAWLGRSAATSASTLRLSPSPARGRRRLTSPSSRRPPLAAPRRRPH